MRQPKVFILYRKHNSDDEDRAKEIKKAVFTASQMISKPVDIELTSNPHEFESIQVKPEEMPVTIVNNSIVFTKHVPPVEYIKQKDISTTTVEVNEKDSEVVLEYIKNLKV